MHLRIPHSCHGHVLVVAAATLLSLVGESGAAAKLEYNRDVRPILAENCFACHGPDSAARKAGLRLDQRDAAIQAKAIVPKDLEKSEAYARIISNDDNEVMPPPETKKKLTDAQKAILKRWIEEGAEYQPHWSFLAVQRPPLPAVKNEKWVRNPVDRFILAELEKVGLTPAPEADRRTLARRLSLDLTGLPPKPEDVEAFVYDPSPDAYEKYVDSLLCSPHWGEHRGRAWLDVARYADTHGIHFDNYREIWAYRDWVIQAFNENKRFDQFSIEQLAGDLLPNPTIDQRIATGFNRCNITTNEGGVIAEEYLVLYTRDRTETVNQVWMGLTANCAVCHDHKYDPLTMRDFYSMSAFFNNTTQGAMDGNIPNTPPIIVVPRLEDRKKFDEVTRKLTDVRTRLDARKKETRPLFERWLAEYKPTSTEQQVPTDGLVFHAPLSEGTGKQVTIRIHGKEKAITLDSGFEWVAGRTRNTKGFAIRPGQSIESNDVGDFEKHQPFSISGWIQIQKRGQFGAIASRMDKAPGFRGWDMWVQNDRVGMHIIGNWEQDALKVVAKTPLQPAKWHHVLISYDGSGKAAGVRIFVNGELQAVDVEADRLRGSIKTSAPFKIGQRSQSQRLQNIALQDIRLYTRSLATREVEQLAKSARTAELLNKPADKRTPQETDELFSWWLNVEDKATQELGNELSQLQQEEVAIRSRGTIAHVMQERPSEPMAYILARGEYDKRKDPVKAATPTVLPPMPADLPRNRLGFAQWLFRPEHPLTARVTVNRFWQEIFGTGIVRTSGDFGVSGELPTHPELLDWMAAEFREQGWDVKRFFKMLVTSATYRQAAVVTREKLEKDPSNRLLSRGPRFRMDAEMIRDYALAATGLLHPKIGGPSVKPYQPEGVWEAVAMIGSNTRNYQADKGENLYRRSMYTFWKRSAPPASMEIFNAPNRETCTVRRDRTNTPLQALVTLNDPQFVEAARFLAQRALKEGGTTDVSKLDYIIRRLLARPLTEQEQAIALGSLKELRQAFAAKPADAKKLIAVGDSKPPEQLDPVLLATWTMLINELMNLDEMLNK